MSLVSQIIDYLSPEQEFRSLPLEAQTEVAEELVRQIDNWKNAPVELRLCEATRLWLKPNVNYIFSVDPACGECRAAEMFAAG